MTPSIRAVVHRALIGLSIAGLALAGAPTATMAQEDLGAPGTAITAGQLRALSNPAWDDNDRELLEQVYAPDAVHTATFYDRTNEYEGIDAIASVAMLDAPVSPTGPLIELPAPEGELRWIGFIDLAGGTACLSHAVDGRITRNDCLVPQNSYDSRSPASVIEGGDQAELEMLVGRLRSALESRDIEQLAEVYAADAVHSTRFTNVTRRYVGPEEISRVLRGAPAEIVPPIPFEAPDGELAWAVVNDLGMTETVCLFRARDGQIFRQDCLLDIPG